MPADYRVHLDAFEGPLDLLLYLIRRAEVDVTDIPISSITDQYLAYLEDAGGIAHIDIELAGEFLVMAATLMEIKSRMLMPAAAATPRAGPASSTQNAEPIDEIDPRADLVRQLLEYKKYRDAADSLEHRLREWESRYPSARALVDRDALSAASAGHEPTLDMEDIHLADLLEAFAKIIDTVDLSRVGEHHVALDETPIELHSADLIERLRSARLMSPAPNFDSNLGASCPGVEFRSLFAGRSRSEMIGLFLAMLELVRQHRVVIQQDGPGSPIHLSLGPSEIDPAESHTSAPAIASADQLANSTRGDA